MMVTIHNNSRCIFHSSIVKTDLYAKHEYHWDIVTETFGGSWSYFFNIMTKGYKDIIHTHSHTDTHTLSHL